MVEVMREDREAAARYLVAIVPEMPTLAARVMENQTALSRAFARHRIAARKQALEEAAKAAHEHLYPSNPEDDWARYAMDKARFARTTATAIRALSDSHVDQD